MADTYHIVPQDDKWALRKAGNQKSSGVFNTQKEAIEKGRNYAKKQGTELAIHGKDGRIREKNSYGLDYCPPEG